MNFRIKQIIAALALGAVSYANAGCMLDYFCYVKPYVGADFKYWNIDSENDLSNFAAITGVDDLFQENYYGGTVYVGARWCNMIGLELGWDLAAVRHKQLYGSTLISDPENEQDPFAVGDAWLKTKSSFNGPYIDLSGYYPICHCLELIGTIGVAQLEPNVAIDVMVFEAITNSNGFAFVGRAADGKSTTVARVGGGMQYMLNRCTGVRTIMRWENTSNIKVWVNDDSGNRVSIKPFENAFTATVGLFVNF